jgi:hypothetical protein
MTSERADQRRKLVETLRMQSESCTAAARLEVEERYDFAIKSLQLRADAINELVGYIESPTLADAISLFHDSSEERSKASVDLKAYLLAAGLTVSDRATFQLFDNNWCTQAVVSYIDAGHTHTVGVHYDSNSGWGVGVCP